MRIIDGLRSQIEGHLFDGYLRKVRATGKHRRRRARRVRVGRADGQLTPAAGLEAVRELDRVLGATRALEAGIGAVKKRRRGLGGGALVMARASCQLTGGDFLVSLVSLDRRRADLAGQLLEPVPTPAATTAAGIAKRFTDTHLRGIEKSLGTVNTTMVALVGQVRRSTLLKVATINGDATDVEVYGRQKEQVEYNHTGQRNLRAHIAFWAEAGVPLAAELMAGAADPRSNSVQMLDRAIAALPAGVEHIKARWDAGYFARELAAACVERGVEFAIGAERTEPVFAAARTVPGHEWVPAIGGYSFILTNLDVSDDEKLAGVQWWYRHRTDIEALNKDAKHGGSLRHLPSKYRTVNAVWMWGHFWPA